MPANLTRIESYLAKRTDEEKDYLFMELAKERRARLKAGIPLIIHDELGPIESIGGEMENWSERERKEIIKSLESDTKMVSLKQLRALAKASKRTVKSS